MIGVAAIVTILICVPFVALLVRWAGRDPVIAEVARELGRDLPRATGEAVVLILLVLSACCWLVIIAGASQ